MMVSAKNFGKYHEVEPGLISYTLDNPEVAMAVLVPWHIRKQWSSYS
jgi:hypothetical protein